ERLRVHFAALFGELRIAAAAKPTALLRFEALLVDADLHGMKRPARFEVERVRAHAAVLAIRTVGGVENDGEVFHAAADGADLVHSPTERHGAVAADAAIGGSQAGGAADAAGGDDGAESFRTERKAHESGGSGGRGAGGRAAGAAGVVA